VCVCACESEIQRVCMRVRVKDVRVRKCERDSARARRRVCAYERKIQTACMRVRVRDVRVRK